MKDSRNVTILLLLVSAFVLGGMLIALNQSEKAVADMSVRGGEYIMATGQWNSSADFLYVIDLRARRLNVYWLNEKTKSLSRVKAVDLKQVFQD